MPLDKDDPAGSPSFLQSDWWFSVKAVDGWRGYRVPSSESHHVAGFEPGVVEPGGLLRRIGPFSLVYLPYAFERSSSIDTVVDAMRLLATDVPENVTFLRWDCPWESRRFDDTAARTWGLLPSPMRVQPPDTVVVDLRGTEDDLLAAMKSKTRYNIRLARKRGVEVQTIRPGQDGAEEALTAWYRLYQVTARRDRIAIHPFDYYRRVFYSAGPITGRPDATIATRTDPQRELLLSLHDGDLLGGIVTLSYGGTTTYLYGAGADIKRNLMASYLLQWEAIRRARAAGDRWYDLFGIPPTADPVHPMHGLYRFKTGFGGRIIHRAGAWDLPIRPMRARAYRGAERLRRWYYFSFRKRGS